jgi:hypothetical protein
LWRIFGVGKMINVALKERRKEGRKEAATTACKDCAPLSRLARLATFERDRETESEGDKGAMYIYIHKYTRAYS